MSLDKAIAHDKEHRRPYYKSGRFDPSCRPGGDCPACESNRRHAQRQREAAAEATREDVPSITIDSAAGW